HESIKFDCTYSNDKINFLDTTVFKNDRKSLSTKLFTKPTDRPGYIHSKSYHPRSQIDNIPYGQALRAKRISTEESDLQQALEKLKENFMSRGYKEKQLTEQFTRIHQVERKELLTYKKKKQDNKPKFITKYNKNLPNLRKIIEENWTILSTNDKIAQVFKDKPILTFRRNKNLNDLIGGNKLQDNRKITNQISRKGHCRPCHSQVGNICCQHITQTNAFKSAITGEEFHIKHNVNCKTRKGIYLASCKLCPKHQYVGKFETPWNVRLYNHRKDAKKMKSIPFDEHFLKSDHDFTKHARFIIIEALSKETAKEIDRKTLEAREDYWISRLKTHSPNGFNERWNCNIRNRIQQICT
ncbi:MAG: hypothetical protein MK200_08895, partial [Nitrosopumilus sp.]|nr:hypothetical protein [Nitrosopumilus sp.]